MAKQGDILDNKYIILDEVGKGGMSTVYLARDKRLNKNWAVKEVRKQGLDPRMNAVAGNSAYVEAEMVKSLDNYYIPHVNDILENDDFIYVVMDYIEGESLEKILLSEGAQPENQVIKWGRQLCEALHYLHSQNPPIIYRDMKPANVMIKPDGDVKLIDFGIARTYKAENTSDTQLLGTAGYAPREQFGRGQTDARSDIYSLGATLYHAVTGHGPNDGEEFLNVPIRRWNPGLSGGLEKIIRGCTMPNPAERYQSCGELMYDLDHYREVDDAFIAGKRRLVRRFFAAALLAIIFLGAGFFGRGMQGHTVNQDYAQNLMWAEKAGDQGEAAGYYLRMAEIKPDEPTAYLGLIELFKSDTAFSLEEEGALLPVLTKNLSALREREGYPRLAYEMGKLYWYYYEYGRGSAGGEDSNQSTRMKSARRWFSDVIEYGGADGPDYKVAKVYHDIGKFKEEIYIEVAEASDSGKYRPYWENLKELFALVAGDEGNGEIVRLTVDAIVLEAVSAYARKFKGDGVDGAEVLGLAERAAADAEAVHATTDKTAALRAEIIGPLAGLARDTAKNAYREDERGLVY